VNAPASTFRDAAVHTFIQKLAEKVTGTLECLSRVILAGHSRSLRFPQRMESLPDQYDLVILGVANLATGSGREERRHSSRFGQKSVRFRKAPFAIRYGNICN
jgi:hypothetical protein